MFKKLASSARSRWYVVAAVVGVVLIVLPLVGFFNFVAGLESYCDVRLTYNQQEVLYRLGYPPAVLGELKEDRRGRWQRVYSTDRERDPKNAMPEDKKIEDFLAWSYYTGEATVSVTFDAAGKRIESVSCLDLGEPPSSAACPSLVGVTLNDTEEDVRRKLGQPFRSKLDGVAKTIRYDNLGIELLLTKGKVYGITLLGTRADTYTILTHYLRALLN